MIRRLSVRPARFAVATCLLSGLCATAGWADGVRQQMFPSNVSCYLRYYNDDHLNQHPAQQVAQVLVGPDYDHFGETPLPLRFVINTRGDFAEYRSIAYCEEGPKAMRCQLEGDGGAFQLEPGRDGAIKLTLSPDGITMEGGSGFLELSGQMGDDRAFLLPSVPADSCP